MQLERNIGIHLALHPIEKKIQYRVLLTAITARTAAAAPPFYRAARFFSILSFKIEFSSTRNSNLPETNNKLPVV